MIAKAGGGVVSCARATQPHVTGNASKDAMSQRAFKIQKSVGQDAGSFFVSRRMVPLNTALSNLCGNALKMKLGTALWILTEVLNVWS